MKRREGRRPSRTELALPSNHGDLFNVEAPEASYAPTDYRPEAHLAFLGVSGATGDAPRQGTRTVGSLTDCRKGDAEFLRMIGRGQGGATVRGHFSDILIDNGFDTPGALALARFAAHVLTAHRKADVKKLLGHLNRLPQPSRQNAFYNYRFHFLTLQVKM